MFCITRSCLLSLLMTCRGRQHHTRHILLPSEIDLRLFWADFTGSEGKHLFHRIGWKGRIWQPWASLGAPLRPELVGRVGRHGFPRRAWRFCVCTIYSKAQNKATSSYKLYHTMLVLIMRSTLPPYLRVWNNCESHTASLCSIPVCCVLCVGVCVLLVCA